MCIKENGGLGIGDISIKNKALLNKWVWRYGEEPNALWRAIIDSKYGGTLSTSFRLLDFKGDSPVCGKMLPKPWAVRIFILMGRRPVWDSHSGMAVAFVSGGTNGLRGWF